MARKWKGPKKLHFLWVNKKFVKKKYVLENVFYLYANFSEASIYNIN